MEGTVPIKDKISVFKENAQTPNNEPGQAVYMQVTAIGRVNWQSELN